MKNETILCRECPLEERVENVEIALENMRLDNMQTKEKVWEVDKDTAVIKEMFKSFKETLEDLKCVIVENTQTSVSVRLTMVKMQEEIKSTKEEVKNTKNDVREIKDKFIKNESVNKIGKFVKKYAWAFVTGIGGVILTIILNINSIASFFVTFFTPFINNKP